MKAPKLKYVIFDRVVELIPSWINHVDFALALDGMLQLYAPMASVDRSRPINFWGQFNVETGRLEIKEPDEYADNSGFFVITGYEPICGSSSQIEIPFLSLLERDDERLGRHSLYMHGVQTEVALYYLGITMQGWHKRLNQHLSEVRTGSPYVFHQALSRHQDKRFVHKVIVHNVSYETVMELEEQLVDEISLYPKGLNMIPGGFAGIRYLGSLGYANINSEKQRHRLITSLIKQPSIKGAPNPLCSARWASDQDFVNRVICGHASRLTVDQVRQIRMYNSFGKELRQIAEVLEITGLQRIKNVLSNKRYSRVV